LPTFTFEAAIGNDEARGNNLGFVGSD